MTSASDGTERNWVAGQGVVESLAAVRMADGADLLASTGSTGRVLLHEPSGRLVGDFDGAEFRWLAGTISGADGRQLLVLGGYDGRVHLVDPETGRPVRHLTAGDTRVAAAGVLSDGRAVVATVGKDRIIRVWDPMSGALLHELLGHKAAATALAIGEATGGGLMLASADVKGAIRLWSLAATEKVRELAHPHSLAIRALAFVRTMQGQIMLASADGHVGVTLWDPFTGEQIRHLTGDANDQHWVNSLAAVPAANSVLLASGGEDTTVRLWDPHTGALVQTMTGHSQPVRALALVTVVDGSTLLASAGEDVRLWSPTTGELVHQYPGHTDGLTTLAVTSMPGRGAVIAASGPTGAVRLWDPVNGQHLAELSVAGSRIIAAVDLPDGHSVLACASPAPGVLLVDPATGEIVQQLRWPRQRWRRSLRRGAEPLINAFATFSKNGQLVLAAACSDGVIRMWDVAGGGYLRQVVAHHDEANALIVATTPEDLTPYLLSGGDDGVLRGWDITDSTLDESGLQTPTSYVNAIAVVTLPDGRIMIAYGGDDNIVRLWDRSNEAWYRELVGHTDWIRALAVVSLPSGRPLLASASDDSTVRLWDPVTGQEVRRLTGHTGYVRALATVELPDGRTRLVSAGDDGILRLWNPATGALITRFGGSSDRPARQDLIGRDVLVTALATALRPRRPVTADRVINEVDTEDETGPTVVTVEGRWGSGKTSLMRLARAELQQFEAWPDRSSPRNWRRRVLNHRPVRNVIARWRRQLRVVSVDRAPPDWWFIRYRDPQWHLRLRIALDHADEFGPAAGRVTSWATELRRAGLVNDLQYAAYYPESGRWGSAEAMAAAERVFGADSRALLPQFATPDIAPAQALTAAHFVAIAIGYTGGTAAGMHWLIAHARPDKPTTAPDRALLHETIRLADPTDDWSTLRAIPAGAAVVDTFAARAQALAAYRPLVETTDGIDHDDVLVSLLHVHHIRAVGLDRDDERACLHLARAATLAWRARRKAKP